MKKSSFLFAGLMTLVAIPASAATAYQLVDLSEPATINARATGINNLGQIVGWTTPVCLCDYGTQAVIWNGGVQSYLSSAASGYGSASAINDYGVVVGNQNGLAVTWSDGVATALPTAANLAAGYATAINNAGVIVGYSHILKEGYSANTATMWKDGAQIDLGGSGNILSNAAAINNQGVIAGYDYHNSATSGLGNAAVWVDGVATNLTPGVITSKATGINDLGQVIGTSIASFSNTNGTAMLWSGDTATVLQSISPSITYSLPNDINNLGAIVGTSTNAAGASLATIWVQNSGFDLNALVDFAGTQFINLDVATSINDRGQIVGYGTTATGIHAFLLSPVPEPAQLWTMLAGLVVLATTWARQRRRSALGAE